MALQTIQERIYFPARLGLASKSIAAETAVSTFIDGTNDSRFNSLGVKLHNVGLVQWQGGAGSFAIDKVYFRVGTLTTNLSAGTNQLTVSVEGVAQSATARIGNGVPYSSGTTSADLTAASANVVTMSSTTPVAHGQQVAVCFEMTQWTNADFHIGAIDSSAQLNDPCVYSSGGATPGGFASAIPNVVFQSTTGEWGIIAGGGWAGDWDEYRFDSTGTTTPSVTTVTEYGNVFRVPFRCRATGFWYVGRAINSTVTLQANLYRGSLASPGGAVATVSGDLAKFGALTSSARLAQVHFSPVTIEKDTDYIVTLQATGTDDYRLPVFGVGVAGAANALPGGTDTYMAYRVGTSAFQADNTKYFMVGIVIDQIDDSSGLWAPGSGTTGNTLKVEVDPSAVGETAVSGVVFASPDGVNIVGPMIGEFTGENFESTLENGKAVLKVPVSEFGGTGLLLTDTPVVLLRNNTYTTGIVSATVINE